MNNLLEELEALKISGDLTAVGLWTACIDLIEKTYVPVSQIGTTRPCQEEDYIKYREIVDRNLRNIHTMLQHLIHSHNEQHMQINLSESTVTTFAIKLLILIGEQHEKNIWNTEESVSISKELMNDFFELHGYQSIAQFLMKQNNFNTLLLVLRPKLLEDSWKAFPSALACYKWILYQVEKPALYTHMENVLPTALIAVNDFVPENVVIGLECLHQIIQHSHLKKGLVDSGYANAIFHALEPLTHKREARYVILVYLCITSLLATIEYWDKSLNVFEWTMRDNVLAVLLDNMELEQCVEFRRVYMMSLRQLLTNVGCAKWCKRLTRILSEYCEHHTDLQTLKATLETAKTFVLMFHLRAAAHCTPLYTAFLKLHHDLTKTPVFDKEIMQNLEDCICLLYKASPNVGCVVINDDRIQSLIKNNLPVVCLGDTKYFQ